MIKIKMDAQRLNRDLQNIVGFADGFVQGIESGQPQFIENLGREVIEDLKDFIDANARLDSKAMHHVYEWYQTGSPEARLFDIDYVASSTGLSINSTFRQSVTVRKGSSVPFYNKAEIMENGIPVIIRPIRSDALVFEEGGETVFTKKPINVVEPGGGEVQGSYERVFNNFFANYFTQSFLRHSKVMQRLKTPTPFYANFYNAKRGGRSAGTSLGRRWISGGAF